MSNERKRMGRPPLHGDAMMQVIPCRLPADLIEAIDEIAKHQPTQPTTRNGMIRDMLWADARRRLKALQK